MKKWFNPHLPQILTRLYHLLLLLGLVSLLIYGTINALEYRTSVIASIDPQMAGKDMVSVWDRMMRKMAPDLPDHGVAGYLADWDIPGNTFGSSDQTVEYLLTQYSLAPLTLQRGADFPVVIGNFSDTNNPEKIPGILKMFNVTIAKQHTNEIFILKGLDE